MSIFKKTAFVAFGLCSLTSILFIFVKKELTLSDIPVAEAVSTKNILVNKKKVQVSMVSNPVTSTKTDSKFIFNVTQIPLGDGKISTAPKRGYVYSCQTHFNANAGGASKNGDWIHGNVWNLTEKIHVQGSVTWSQVWFKEQTENSSRSITGNGLPLGSNTGVFPISQSDPAFQIDRNPNSIKEQDIHLSIPASPTMATNATCVPMGMIGVALNGVAIYNALDGRGDDAVAHEVQDTCNGHPERSGEYHYHGPSSCMPGADKKVTLVGYALDGYGIYSRFDAAGNEYKNSDLDVCHGTSTTILWNGKTTPMYHYVMTQEYPYTIGCFKGTPIVSTIRR